MRLPSVLVTAAFLFAAPVESGAASLEQELGALLLDHPSIRAAAKTVEASRQEIRRVKSDYLPQISVSSEVAAEVIDSPAERQQGDGQEGKPSSRTAERASFSMTQNLFNGFQTSRKGPINRIAL